jgi:hypothetical protein
MNWKKDEYLASWPKAVPYPYALARSGRPVPNRSSVDWPQAQWAPLYLPPGSPSVQPYRYPANVPLESISIVKMMRMLPPTRDAQRGPAGDIVATDNDCLPSSYGAITGPVVRQGMMPARLNPDTTTAEPSFLENNGWWLAGAGAIAAILYFNRGKKSSSGSSKQVNWEEAYKTLKWCHNPKR